MTQAAPPPPALSEKPDKVFNQKLVRPRSMGCPLAPATGPRIPRKAVGCKAGRSSTAQAARHLQPQAATTPASPGAAALGAQS